MSDFRPRRILFLCTGNSARSILAEAILRRSGAGRFEAASAGSKPLGQVNPHAIALLERLGFDTDGLASKSWHDFAAASAAPFDLIVTVCDNAAGESCPLWPGEPRTVHWGIPDPAAAAPEQAEAAFRLAFKRLEARVQDLLELNFAEIDGAEAMDRLRAIGQRND